MHYLGSKNKHAKQILEHVLAKRKPGQTYVEPFVGGANVLKYVPAEQGPRIGADLNRYMVALHTALASGWKPPETMTKKEFEAIKKNPDAHEPALVAFAATGPTFGSMWMGQWAKDYPGMEGTRYRQARDAALKDAPGLAGATFYHASFEALEIPPNSLIYCDPPYAGTTGYAGTKTTIKVGESSMKNEWRADKFWKWADRRVEEGHTVFVSEYKGPEVGFYLGGSSPEVKAAQAAYRELFASPGVLKAGVADGAMLAGQRAIQEAELNLESIAVTKAARWKPVWEKEVTSDFSASRTSREEVEDKENELESMRAEPEKNVLAISKLETELKKIADSVGKKETEKLFHREA